MAQIELSNIVKSFGDTPVLKGIDLSIGAGEFVTLVGPSGCGKSTLLRILAGLEAADAGTVEIDGRNVTDVRPADRNLAMVFQSYALYPHLTVAQNMMTPLKLRDLSWVERLPIAGPMIARQKYRALLDQTKAAAQTLKIQALLDRKPGQLSGGQRQRAALGRAMVRNPTAFLMDEPLSNLDAALRVHMRSELSELHRRLETTFVYVTHDQAEALTMSDRMAVMLGGAILQIGPPDEIYNNPQSLEVAKFVGSPAINLIPGEIDDGQIVRMQDLVLGRVPQTERRAIQVGIRPEHLTLGPKGLGGRVVHRENLGSDLYLHVKLVETGGRIVVRTPPNQTAQIGDVVYVEPDASRALIFDKNGARMPLAAAELARIA